MSAALANALFLRPVTAEEAYRARPGTAIIVKDERGGCWIWPIDARLIQ